MVAIRNGKMIIFVAIILLAIQQQHYVNGVRQSSDGRSSSSSQSAISWDPGSGENTTAARPPEEKKGRKTPFDKGNFGGDNCTKQCHLESVKVRTREGLCVGKENDKVTHYVPEIQVDGTTLRTAVNLTTSNDQDCLLFTNDDFFIDIGHGTSHEGQDDKCINCRVTFGCHDDEDEDDNNRRGGQDASDAMALVKDIKSKDDVCLVFVFTVVRRQHEQDEQDEGVLFQAAIIFDCTAGKIYIYWTETNATENENRGRSCYNSMPKRSTREEEIENTKKNGDSHLAVIEFEGKYKVKRCYEGCLTVLNRNKKSKGIEDEEYDCLVEPPNLHYYNKTENNCWKTVGKGILAKNRRERFHHYCCYGNGMNQPCRSFAFSIYEDLDDLLRCLDEKSRFENVFGNDFGGNICVNNTRKQSLTISGGWGDTHMALADGVFYTFEDYYIYILIRSPKNGEDLEAFKCEAMFKTWDRSSSSSLGTQIQAVGCCGKEYGTPFTLEVMDDGSCVLRYIMGSNVKRVDLEGIASYQKDGIHLVRTVQTDSYDIYTISSDIITLEVRVIHTFSTMHVTTFYDQTYNDIFGVPRGLLGTPNGIVEDDFTRPDGESIDMMSSDRDIHNEFGKTWRTESTCLSLANFDYEAAAKYEPFFLDLPSVPQNIMDVCDNIEGCIHDHVATGSPEYALETRRGEEDFYRLRSEYGLVLPTIEGALIWEVERTTLFTTTLTVVDTEAASHVWRPKLDTNENQEFDLTDGVVSWTPSSDLVRSISVTVVAQDDTSRESIAFIPFILYCDCNSNGVCDYSNYQPGFETSEGFRKVACKCMPGYEGTECNSQIEFCSGDIPCLDVSSCISLPPEQLTDPDRKVNCTKCKTGYIHEDDYCKDVDECMTPDICASMDHTVCQNSEGSYKCICEQGYEDIDGSCEDVDECDLGLGIDTADCEHNCTNNLGSYECSCYPGYTMDNNLCNPDASVVCTGMCNETTSICVNIPGTGPDCMCKRGYTFTGSICEDIHECADKDLNNCRPGTNCIEGSPGYTCSCPAGQKMNNTRQCETCDDNTWGIDCAEICNCKDDNTICDPETGCQACPNGYEGGSCTRIPCTIGGTDCEDNSTCRLEGTIPTCECDDNYERNLETFTCVAVDACISHPCENGGACSQEKTTYRCNCTGGYTGENCDIEINECAENNVICQNGGTCVDKLNRYRCACAPSYHGPHCEEKGFQRPGNEFPAVFFFVEDCYQGTDDPDATTRATVKSYVKERLKSEFEIDVLVDIIGIGKSPTVVSYDLTLPEGEALDPQQLVTSLTSGLTPGEDGGLYMESTDGSRCQVNECGVYVGGANSIPGTSLVTSPLWPVLIGSILAFLTVFFTMILLLCCCPGFIGCCRLFGFSAIRTLPRPAIIGRIRRFWHTNRPRGTLVPGPVPGPRERPNRFGDIPRIFRRRRGPTPGEEVYGVTPMMSGARRYGPFGPQGRSLFGGVGSGLSRQMVMPGRAGRPLPPLPSESRTPGPPPRRLPRMPFSRLGERFTRLGAMFRGRQAPTPGMSGPRPPPGHPRNLPRMPFRGLGERFPRLGAMFRGNVRGWGRPGPTPGMAGPRLPPQHPRKLNPPNPQMRGPSMPQNLFSRIFDMQRRGQLPENVPMRPLGLHQQRAIMERGYGPNRLHQQRAIMARGFVSNLRGRPRGRPGPQGYGGRVPLNGGMGRPIGRRDWGLRS